MAQIKLQKHEVYNYLADHPEWFQNKYNAETYGKEKYLTCAVIENRINQELRKGIDDITKADYIVLRGATLTALVYDGVLNREYSEMNRCYKYCLVLPIREGYRLQWFGDEHAT